MMQLSQHQTESSMTLTQALDQIAKQTLGLETLETRNSDGLDFHDLNVASIKAALLAAYQAGQQSRSAA
jgi:hypothetical protein